MLCYPLPLLLLHQLREKKLLLFLHVLLQVHLRAHDHGLHLRHDRGQKGLALRAEFIARGLVMAVAVDAESLSDGGLFFRHVVLYFYRFPFRQETRKNAHVESPFASWNVPCGGTLYILKVFNDKSKSPLTSVTFIVKFISKSILGVVYVMAGR